VSGELSCWGDDARGQLGDGAREPRAKPIVVAKGIDDVAAGAGFTCVLEKGAVRCWGALREQDLGPTRADLEALCKASPSERACENLAAIKKMEKRFGLKPGAGTEEDQAERTTSRAIAPAVTDAVSISAGGDTVCTLDKSGRATCFLYAAPGSTTASIWGKEKLGKPALVPGVSDLVEVAPGLLQTCGRTKAGAVKCWSKAGVVVDVPGVSGAKSVGVSQEQACAVDGSGAVSCWSTRGAPALIKIEGLVKASVVRGGGTQSMCAELESGEVRCWGRLGEDWFAGLRGVVEEATPKKIEGAGGASMLAVGGGHACAVTADGVRCWGSTRRGVLGDDQFQAEVLRPTRVALDAKAVDVAADAETTCAALADGQVRCWGAGFGSLGARADGPAMRPISGVTAASRVFVGEQSSCAIADGAVQCWGNGGGESATTIPKIDDALSVAPGLMFLCAARKSGETSCFYGTGDPAPLPGVRDLVELGYGASDWSCGRTKSGGMTCWSMPIAVPGPTFPAPKLVPISGVAKATSVTTSAFRACAAQADGSVMCAGSMSKTHVATKHFGFSDVAEVRVANVGTIGSLLCARTRSGEVKCEGDGRWGELGVGTFTPPRFPGIGTALGLTDARRIAVGGEHACALRDDGSVWCWGSDTFGQATGTAHGVRRCARPIARP